MSTTAERLRSWLHDHSPEHARRATARARLSTLDSIADEIEMRPWVLLLAADRHYWADTTPRPIDSENEFPTADELYQDGHKTIGDGLLKQAWDPWREAILPDVDTLTTITLCTTLLLRLGQVRLLVDLVEPILSLGPVQSVAQVARILGEVPEDSRTDRIARAAYCTVLDDRRNPPRAKRMPRSTHERIAAWLRSIVNGHDLRGLTRLSPAHARQITEGGAVDFTLPGLDRIARNTALPPWMIAYLGDVHAGEPGARYFLHPDLLVTISAVWRHVGGRDVDFSRRSTIVALAAVRLKDYTILRDVLVALCYYGPKGGAAHIARMLLEYPPDSADRLAIRAELAQQLRGLDAETA